MDDNTITEYGWIVIVVSVIVVALLFVPQLNNIIANNSEEQIKKPLEEGSETITSYTQYDVDNSNGLLVAIGKTDPLDVVARFTHDYQSVIITKNGAESDGVIGSFPEEYRIKFSSATIADGIVTIGKDAFADCTNLKGIDIASSVKVIEEGAFSGCTALKNIAFSGTSEQWDKITFGGAWKTEADKIVQYVD